MWITYVDKTFEAYVKNELLRKLNKYLWIFSEFLNIKLISFLKQSFKQGTMKTYSTSVDIDNRKMFS